MTAQGLGYSYVRRTSVSKLQPRATIPYKSFTTYEQVFKLEIVSNLKYGKEGPYTAHKVRSSQAYLHHGVLLTPFRVATIFPITNDTKQIEAKPSSIEGEESAYRRLRITRSDARLIGVREKRAKLKAEQAEAQKK